MVLVVLALAGSLISAGSAAPDPGLAPQTILGTLIRDASATLYRGLAGAGPEVSAAEPEPQNSSPALSTVAVTNGNDSGVGSLRNAIAAATPGDTIIFAGVTNVTLTTSELVINKNLTIDGPGVTVSRGIGAPSFRIFNVVSGVSATISGLTISGGRTPDFGFGLDAGFGGGIINAGTLTLSGVTISGNATGAGDGGTVGGSGGGISNSGTLTITESTISANSTGMGGNGLNGVGGNGGNGGGIQNSGTLTIVRSTISGNTTGVGGGGLGGGGTGGNGAAIFSSGTLRVLNSTLSGNLAGRGGNASIEGAGAGSGGSGGGIFSSGSLELTNCTISGNSAGEGGFSSDPTTGAPGPRGPGGKGGGIRSGNSQTSPAMRNTIVASNGAPGTGPDVSGGFSSQGRNLIGKNDDAASSFPAGNPNANGDIVGTSAVPVNPLLGGLANNGGPTRTQALLPGSPAINAGDNCVAQAPGCLSTPLTTDQRGLSRQSGSSVDIGAFESRGFTIALTGGSNQTATINKAFSDPLVVTITSSDPVEGTVINFVAPGSGASASIPSATVNAAGQASTIATANSEVGTYNVVVNLNGQTVSFTLTNNCPATTLVTNTNDAGTGSLRQAVIFGCPNSTTTVVFSNSTANGATNFYDGNARTIALTSGEIAIGTNLVIQGPGANLLSVSGNQNSRVFSVPSGLVSTIAGLSVVNGRVTNNITNTGGGIINSGTLTVSNSRIADNFAGGGSSSNFNNGGGGIFNTGTLRVVNSTVSGNSAGTGGIQNFGGGIYNSGSLTIVNSTIWGNSISNGLAKGGGVFNDASGVLRLTNTSISGNAGALMGCGVSNAGSFISGNSIIAGNQGCFIVPDVDGTLQSEGHNLIGSTQGVTITGITAGNLLDVNPQFSPFGLYGGPTPTLALSATSPAINAGSNALALDPNGQALTTDQRGFGRYASGTVDMGAIEVQTCSFTVTNPSISNVIVGSPFSQTFTQTGGVGAVTYVTNSVLPAGMTLNGNGTLSGTPTQSGLFPIVVTAYDTNGCTGTTTFNLIVSTIACPLATLSTPESLASAGTAYNSSVAVSPAPSAGRSYTYALADGTSLPPGLALDAATGAITGSPTALGAFTFTIRAELFDGQTPTGCILITQFTITVACPTITLNTPPGTITVGSLYSGSVAASPAPSGAASYRYSLANGSSLPFGWTLNANTGEILGYIFEPQNPITFSVTAQLYAGSDPIGCPRTQEFTITTSCPTIVMSSPTGSATIGTPYSSTVAATPPLDEDFFYRYSLANGTSLPPGLTLNQNTGEITGTPRGVPGQYDFSILVELRSVLPSSACPTTRNFTITVTCSNFSPVVTNTNDSGPGSLREAMTTACSGNIEFSNTTADGATNFYDGNSRTITLTSGPLQPSANLTINGPGASKLTVSGNNQSRVLFITDGVAITINGLKISGGRFGDAGGILIILASLTFRDSVLSENVGTFGGGIANLGGTLTVIRSTISNNSVFGQASRQGVGIYNDGVLTVVNSTIANNSSTTGVGSGGIYNGRQNLGGIPSALLINSTVSGNSSSVSGGGIYNEPSGTGFAGGVVTIRNSIIAGNSAPSAPDVFGAFVSSGFNLIGNTAGATISGTTTGNILNTDARLAPLGNYGGPTPTLALLANSPAINAGNNALAVDQNNQPLTTDQRGAGRVGNVDIGAFELNNTANGGGYRASLPAGTRGVPYSYSITPNNGTTAYSITGGSLPNGLSLSTNPSTNGVVSISGTPQQSGTFNFSVTATNGGNSVVTDYSLLIVDPSPLTLTVDNTGDNAALSACTAAANDCSLRGAIGRANASPAANTINFDPSLAGKTILLANGWNNAADTAALRVAGDLSIQGLAGNAGVTISVAGGVQKRHILVESTGSLTVSNLSFTNGYAPDGFGGSIWSFGSLTVRGCTFTGNYATGEAGAIQSWGGAPSLLIENSTFSGNSSGGSVGAVISGALSITLRNLTITGNTAATPSGALVIYQTQATMTNTIVAGNTGGDVASVLGGGFNAQSVNNLIGTGGTTVGLTNGVNGNQLDVADAKLLPLSSYGGPTQTHALMPESPAINAGSTTGAPVSDQRGRPRVGQIDVGAYEASTNLVVTNTLDSGAGSLRAAIASANGTADDESITFAIPSTDSGCVGGVCTIALTSGQLTIDSAATAGSLIIHNSTGANRLLVSGNGASRVFEVMSGGMIAISGLTITGGNTPSYGSGIYNHGALTLNKVAVTNNTATAGGAGIASDNNSLNAIFDSTISGNSTPGNGGGIYFYFTTTAILRNSTVSGNTSGATGGGIIDDSSPMQIVNVTVSGNQAQSGGGIGLVGSGTATALNTIVGDNTASGSGPDIAGTLSSQGYNLIGNTTGATVTGITTGNVLNQSPRLAPLGYYGGTTLTRALLSTSPAINGGTAIGATASDQRGAARVGAVDIGAFELNNSSNGGTFKALLPGGVANTPYNAPIVPNNGSFTYSVTAGALPNGLNLTTSFAPSAVVALSGTPTQSGTFDFSVTASDGTNSKVTNYQLNILGPTSAGVSVSGRVLTSNGAGIRNAIVTFTDESGNTRSFQTGSLGVYRFDGIAAGRTYVIQVVSKRFTFTPRVLTITDDVTELDLVAD